MNYLFFDVESGDSESGLGGLCSFGYVLCDNNLVIKESDDIIINPELKVWDWWALKKILPLTREEYGKASSFPYIYKRIKKLFETKDIIVVNHGIENDIRILRQTCKRYNLDFIDFSYYDSSFLYKIIMNREKIDGLDTVSKEVCDIEERTKHSSQDDAYRVYSIIKKLCENERMSADELFEKYNQKTKLASELQIVHILDFNNNRLSGKENNKLFKKMLKKAKIKKSKDSCYNGMSFMVTSSYESSHFKEMLYIIKLASNKGMKYTLKTLECNVYVKQQDEVTIKLIPL